MVGHLCLTHAIFTPGGKQLDQKPLGRRRQCFFVKKNATSPFFDASGNRNIGATIRIRLEIWCLPYAGFFILLSVVSTA
jgi:hypothetical protein